MRVLLLKNEKIIFKKIAIEKEKNYESIVGFFEILDDKNKIINLQPEIEFIMNQKWLLVKHQ